MSSSDFKLVNIVDSVLEDITSEVTLPVITGASSKTYQNFPAVVGGNTTSQIQFNVQVPSLQTVVSREVMIQTTITLQVNLATAPAGYNWPANSSLFNYGVTNSLCAFPFNSLVSTIQTQVNSSNPSISTAQVLPALLKMYSYEELAKYNSITPALPDSFYQNYAQGLGTNSNILGNFANGSYDKSYTPRGVFTVSMSQNNASIGYQVLTNNAGAIPYNSFLITFTTIEPLLFLSPFISGDSKNKSGLLGLNNLTFTMNIGNASRIISNASYLNAVNIADPNTILSSQTVQSVQLVSITNPTLLFTFLTIPPQLYSKLEPKNICNYTNYQAYPFTQNYNPGLVPYNNANNGIITYQTLTFSNIQLNQIPSKLIVFVQNANLGPYDSNWFLTINNCNINFNNQSGLLSSANQFQLYEMSKNNGLQMTYYEFSGLGVSSVPNQAVPQIVPTIGSILVIDPAIDLGLGAQYTDGSSGQFNLQIQLNIGNQSATAIASVVGTIIAVNGGIFITENGMSSFQTGMITQEMALETKSKHAVLDKSTYEDEIVGGSISNLGSIHKHLKLKYHRAVENEHMMDNEPGESLDDLGGAMSAGAMCASGIHHKHHHKKEHKKITKFYK